MLPDIKAEAALIDSYFCNHKSTAYKARRFLQFLVDKKVTGKFAATGAPRTDRQIALQFYVDWALEKEGTAFHSKARSNTLRYEDIQEAANKLRGQVCDLLEEYYSHAPDSRFRLDIINEKDRFEPSVKPRQTNQSIGSHRQQTFQEETISISHVWKNDRVHDLLRRVLPGAELRLQITGFVDIRVMRTTLQRALEQGAHIRILQTDPDCPILKARFRLRPEMTVSEFRQEMLQQHRILKALAAQAATGSLELRVCDIMPFGWFIQGESADDGPWMVIGLLPAIASYSDGPMIELKSKETELWKLFERTWTESWNSPIEPPPL